MTTRTVTSGDSTITITYRLRIAIRANSRYGQPTDPDNPQRYVRPPKGVKLGKGRWVRTRLAARIKRRVKRPVWVKQEGKYLFTLYYDGTGEPYDKKTHKPGRAAISRAPSRYRKLKKRFWRKRIRTKFGEYIVNDVGSTSEGIRFDLDLYVNRNDFKGYLPVWVQESVIYYHSAWMWIPNE